MSLGRGWGAERGGGGRGEEGSRWAIQVLGGRGGCGKGGGGGEEGENGHRWATLVLAAAVDEEAYRGGQHVDRGFLRSRGGGV